MSTLTLNYILHFLSTYSKPLLYITLLFSILAYFITTKLITPKTQPTPNPHPEKPSPQTASKFKAPERPLGVWTPVEFKRPAAPAYPDWDVHATEPLPYRPFKYGAYHITMGLRNMHWDDWIELDNQFLKFHTIKSQRIKERGEKCCRTAPEAYDGALELLEELSVPFSLTPLILQLTKAKHNTQGRLPPPTLPLPLHPHALHSHQHPHPRILSPRPPSPRRPDDDLRPSSPRRPRHHVRAP